MREKCNVKSNCRLYSQNLCEYIDDSQICERQAKLEFLFREANLSPNQMQPIKLFVDSDGTDLEEFQYLKSLNIVEFIDNGNNLYLYSATPGNGKTSWALKLIQSYLFKIWPESSLRCRALFINVPRFLLELKANISKPSNYIAFINDRVMEADVVIWDDIGTKTATEFEHEHLLSLIDRRLFEEKSNIFTSNIFPNDLASVLGDRLASRIINRSDTKQFKGMDKRGGCK